MRFVESLVSEWCSPIFYVLIEIINGEQKILRQEDEALNLLARMRKS